MNEPHRFKFDLTDKLNLKNPNTYGEKIMDTEKTASKRVV